MAAPQFAQSSESVQPAHRREWAPGALIAIAMGLVYLALRPPLFDIDGYEYYLGVLQPDAFYNVISHHLLWNPIQMLLLRIATSLGYKGPVPFQIFGILLSCATLFFFYVLLVETCRNKLFAAASVLLVAFSPRFWYLGFQNQPYPLMFLAFVLYLHAWRTKDGGAPAGLRLAASGLCLAAAIFMQQGAAFLVPAGGLVLLLLGTDPPRRRWIRAIAWGAGIGAIVVPIYVGLWAAIADPGTTFWFFLTDYLESQHSLQFQFPATLIKTVMGIAGALVQTDQIQSFLEANVTATVVYILYAVMGLLICAAAVALERRAALIAQLTRLIRNNALFAVCVLSIVFWSAFVIAWEPVTSYYWVLLFFPALVCLGLLLRERGWPGLRIFAVAVALLIPLNGYLNRADDLLLSQNFPEPLVASIDQHVGPRDIFVVLGNNDWFGNIDYDLLFTCLKATPRNPGVAIVNDFVLPAGESQPWEAKLRQKIDATMNSGGRVFVAGHVFDPDSYKDLTGTNDAFDPYFNKQNLGLDGPALLAQVKEVFAPYNLEDSDFKIGDDDYFVLRRK
jgi:hypothetical protein